MTPPAVLLEWSFLDALVDAAHDDNPDARQRYSTLVDRYEQGVVRLLARHDHLRRVDRAVRTTLLAPVSPVHVAAQHRRQARRIDIAGDLVPAGSGDVDMMDVAVTLVIMRRERVAELATLDAIFTTLGVAS